MIFMFRGRGDFYKDKVGLAAQPLKRITADLSGMAPITAGLLIGCW